MLQLYKEQNRQRELSEIGRRISADRAMKEHFQKLDAKDKSNLHLLRGENIRSDLRNAAQSLQNRRCKENIILGEESLSKELGEMKQQSLREEKLRQLLWQTAPELRDLRKKFLLAGVTRDQSLQISERHAHLQLKREEEMALAEEARKEKERQEDEERRKEIEEHQARIRYHQDLDELRRFRTMKESFRGRESMEQEKRAVDDILRKIKEEDQEAERRKMEKQKAFYKQAEELQHLRDELQLQQKLKESVQDCKVDEYRRAQELRAKEQSERRQLSMEQKLGTQEKLLSYLESVIGDKLRRDVLRTELAIEEKEEVERGREEDSLRRRGELRRELQWLYDMQIKVKKQREDLVKKEEELYRQNMMTKLYEQDQLDLMSQQRRNQKKMEHLRIVRGMIEENNRKKEMERAKETADQKYQEGLESERAELIKEEKAKFVRDHARELLGFFPKGIFEDNRSVELLGDEFKNFYFQQAK